MRALLSAVLLWFTVAVPMLCWGASDVSGRNPVEEGNRLMREATAHYDADRTVEAVALARQALAIRLRDPARATDAAVSAYRLGVFLQELNRYAEAEQYLRQALALDEANYGADHPEVANDLVELGDVLAMLGRDREALAALDRALDIRTRHLGDTHAAIALVQFARAWQLQSMGHISQALRAAEQALRIRELRFAPNSTEIADSLKALAGIYGQFGRHADALPLLERALAIAELVGGPDSHRAANAANQLAVALDDAGRLDHAAALHQRALGIYQKNADTGSENYATSLNNLGYVYRQLGRYGDALTLFEESLQLRERLYGTSHPDVARSLRHIGTVYLALRKPEQARPRLEAALRILAQAGPARPALLAQVQGSTAEMYQALDQPELAILYGKLAINTLQGMRGANKDLEAESRRGFFDSHAAIYQTVAGWLVDMGRIAEAHQILAMMKEEEYQNYIQRDAAAASANTTLTLTRTELAWITRLTATGNLLFKLAEESRLLQEKKDTGEPLSSNEMARMTEVALQIRDATAAFAKVQGGISAAASSLAPSNEERGIMNETMEGVISELGPDVALLHTVMSPDHLRMTLVRSQRKPTHYRIKVGQVELRGKISRLLYKLRSPKYDPRPEAAALYELLIRPLEADLTAAQIKMLMFNLVGELRYVPMGALYDGKQYLVEKYDLSLFNDAARDRVRDQPQAQWNVLGAGVSQAHTVGEVAFSALAAVPQELAGIVRDADSPDGTLPGQRLLDQDFSVKSLQSALERKPAVVHIASHFNFNPGPEANSFLLLGDGTALTVEAFRSGQFNLQTVDLLTLSACNTGTGSTGGGAEFEGMAVAAQKKGAKSVMASLWRVADKSTGILMQRFYRLHEKKLNKAAALRLAQLEMLRGQGAAAGTGGEKPNNTLATLYPDDGLYVTHPDQPYGHPFFWAPFVLMGNWR